MKSFSNETLTFFFKKFWACYILNLAKTVRTLPILSQKSTRKLKNTRCMEIVERHIFYLMKGVFIIDSKYLLVKIQIKYISNIRTKYILVDQEQLFRGVFRIRSSASMQQFCRKILMPKCDFNNVAK